MTRGPGFRSWPGTAQTQAQAPKARAPRFPLPWPSLLAILLVIVIAFAILAAPVPLTRDRSEASQTFGADAYTRIINQGFAPLNWLVRVGDSPSGAPRVALSREAQRHEEVIRFVRGSYLREDLASSDPDLWQFEGDRVRGINPNAHNLLDPFAWRGRWQGNLSFRGEGAVNDSLGEPYLVTSRGAEIPLSSRFREQEEAGALQIATGETVGDTGRGFAFLDPDGETLATLRMIGNRPVLVIRCNASRTYDVTISTAAYSLRSCRPSERPAGRYGDVVTYPLVDEDRIAFRLRARAEPALTLQLAYGGSLISRHRPFGPRIARGGPGELARHVAQAMDWSVQRRGRDSALARLDVELTLDRQIQATAERELTAYADNLLQQLGRDTQDLFPAAVTVMDAANGELLGLASFPDPARLTSGERQTSSLARNQNFVALPIGSAAKVPISAAILSRFPDLRNLCILATTTDAEGKRRMHEVLGIGLPYPIGDTVTGGQVDFDRFVRNSSNRYGAALMALAAARIDQAADRAGRFVPLRPRAGRPLLPHDAFSMRRAAEGCPGSMSYAAVPQYLFLPLPGRAPLGPRFYQGVEGLPMGLRSVQHGRPSWIDWLRQSFNLAAVAGDPRPTIYDPLVWQPLIGSGGDGQIDRYFAAISPDRERFGLGAAHDLREYLMVMLGGGNARWTTVKLAEAYARVVMAREINARLVRGEGESRQPIPYWPIRPAARQALLSGMRQVGRTGGTGGALEAVRAALPVPAGQEIRLFAKTGTPSLDEPIRSQINALINRLIQSRVLALGADSYLVVPAGAGEAPARALARLATDRRLVYDEADTPAVLVAMQRINGMRRRGHDGGLLFDAGNRLTGILADGTRRRTNEAAEGGVLAVVIGRYCSADTRSLAPRRALSIVVNVQARTVRGGNGDARSGPNPAVDVAGRLLTLDGALAAWLLSDPDGAPRC